MSMRRDTITARYATIVGARFGSLTFDGLSEKRGDRNRIYGRFTCACGRTIDIAVGRVTDGTRTHCGCLGNKRPNLQHGMRGSSEYSSWRAMKARCLDPNNKDYPRWGGKGVTIHPEWINSFEAFYAHVGVRPEGTTLDRIRSTEGYVPGNVRWATAAQQAANRTNSYSWTVKGHKFESAQAAADHFGVSDMTIHRWVKGFFDKRRNSFTPPREDCHAVNKY